MSRVLALARPDRTLEFTFLAIVKETFSYHPCLRCEEQLFGMAEGVATLTSTARRWESQVYWPLVLLWESSNVWLISLQPFKFTTLSCIGTLHGLSLYVVAGIGLQWPPHIMFLEWGSLQTLCLQHVSSEAMTIQRTLDSNDPAQWMVPEDRKLQFRRAALRNYSAHLSLAIPNEISAREGAEDEPTWLDTHSAMYIRLGPTILREQARRDSISQVAALISSHTLGLACSALLATRRSAHVPARNNTAPVLVSIHVGLVENVWSFSAEAAVSGHLSGSMANAPHEDRVTEGEAMAGNGWVCFANPCKGRLRRRSKTCRLHLHYSLACSKSPLRTMRERERERALSKALVWEPSVTIH